MNVLQVMMFCGALVYGVLYLAAVFAASLVWGRHDAAIMTIVAIGVAFLSYAAQVMLPQSRLGVGLVGLSWLCAIGAGVLLVG